MKTVKFLTLGCKVNQYDTQLIREQLLGSGFKEIHNGDSADVYVVNTCTVTGHADADSLNLIRRAARQNPRAKIVVTGCLTELDENKIRLIKGVSIIAKNRDKGKIAGLLHCGDKQAVKKEGISHFQGRTRAFLKIQDGCDNFCSYCKVPFVRGRSRSRLPQDIVAEAEILAENGFKEIVLCGICLGSYGRDLTPQYDIVDVIRGIESLEGILRIRLSSIEANDISEKLIRKIAASGKLCRHLHIPLQSGDDGILKRMNRKYSAGEFARLVARVKKNIPDMAITTDVMIGFPGESDENFKNTAGLIKEVLPLKVHIFPYSRREATPAARFSQDLAPGVIKRRFLHLGRIADECSVIYKKRFLKRRMPVLFEGECETGFWEGYTDNYLKVLLKSGRDLKNDLVTVKLDKIVKDYIRAQDFCLTQ